MNEKIKELAIQANLNSDVVPYHLSDYDLIEYPQVEEFAKLIITKCAEITEDTFHHGYIGAQVMKDYFGVE